MAWLSFDHTQVSSKRWPKESKLPQMRSFLKKQLIKFPCTFWALLLCKIKKKTEQIQSYEDKMTKLPWTKFCFRKTINIFPCLSWPLSLCKIVKQSWLWIQCCEDAPFWFLNSPFAPNKIFLCGKTINIISMYLWAAFH